MCLSQIVSEPSVTLDLKRALISGGFLSSSYDCMRIIVGFKWANIF